MTPLRPSRPPASVASNLVVCVITGDSLNCTLRDRFLDQATVPEHIRRISNVAAAWESQLQTEFSSFSRTTTRRRSLCVRSNRHFRTFTVSITLDLLKARRSSTRSRRLRKNGTMFVWFCFVSLIFVLVIELQAISLKWAFRERTWICYRRCLTSSNSLYAHRTRVLPRDPNPWSSPPILKAKSILSRSR